jgi:hypothetical protein
MAATESSSVRPAGNNNICVSSTSGNPLSSNTAPGTVFFTGVVDSLRSTGSDVRATTVAYIGKFLSRTSNTSGFFGLCAVDFTGVSPSSDVRSAATASIGKFVSRTSTAGCFFGLCPVDFALPGVASRSDVRAAADSLCKFIGRTSTTSGFFGWLCPVDFAVPGSVSGSDICAATIGIFLKRASATSAVSIVLCAGLHGTRPVQNRTSSALLRRNLPFGSHTSLSQSSGSRKRSQAHRHQLSLGIRQNLRYGFSKMFLGKERGESSPALIWLGFKDIPTDTLNRRRLAVFTNLKLVASNGSLVVWVAVRILIMCSCLL